MRKYIFGAVLIILGAAVFFTPFGIAGVCAQKADGSFMKCHWMGESVRMLGGLTAALGIVFCFFKKARTGIAAANIGVSVCLYLLTSCVIGTCKAAAMACNVYTKPTVLLLSGLLLIINAVYLYLTRKDV